MLASNIISVLFRVLRSSNLDMSTTQAKEFVQENIAKSKAVIFSKDWCPYCKMVLETFKKINFPIYTIELEGRNDCREIQEVLGEMTGSTCVPRVFIDGKFVGGGTDIRKLHETGELQKLLSISN